MNILDVKMLDNDAKEETVRSYLKRLLLLVWTQEESFDGKRPFGNSGWKHEIYKSLAVAGIIEATCHADDYGDYYMYGDTAKKHADKLIEEAIKSM